MDAILGTLIVGLAVAIVTQILKMVPAIDKLGPAGKQALVLLVSVLIAMVQYGFGFLNPQVLTAIASVWAIAIGWHQVILSKFEGQS